MPQQLVLTPLGLVTEPNQLGQIPAGALSTAANVVIRSPGKISSAPGWTVRYTLTGTDAGTTCAFVVATTIKYALILFNRTAGWAFTWIDLSTNTAAYGPTALTVNTPYDSALVQSFPITRQPKFCSVLFQGQVFVNAYSAVLTWDTESPTSSTEARPRSAGTPSPQISNVGTTTPGSALAASRYAFVVAMTRRTIQGREYISALSAANLMTASSSATSNHTLVVRLDVGWHRAGDVIEVYRTASKPWVNTAVSGMTLSQLGENAGGEYLLTAAHTLTAAEAAAGTVNISVTGSDTTLGRPCYTNQSIGGVQALMPPALGLMTSYKGYLLGFGPTEPPAYSVRTTAYWGAVNDVSVPQEVVDSSIGRFSLGNLTFTAGLNTATAASAGAISNLRVGSRLLWSSFSRTVTAIAGTTVTFDGAAASGSGSFAADGGDQLSVDEFTRIDVYSGYQNVLLQIYLRHEVLCQALRLGPYSWYYPPVVPAVDVTFRRTLLEDSRPAMQIQATRGANWVPELPEYTATALSVPEKERPNAVMWSENNQPENWPGTNIDHFSRGQPHACLTTRDAVFIWYSDGLWRFSGTGGTAGSGYDWRGDLVATGITISGSQACCVLNDVQYAYTSEGFVSVSSAGQITRISQGRIGDLLPGPPWDDGPYNLDTAVFVCADEENSEIVIKVPASSALYRYNTLTDTFVTVLPNATQTTHAAYSRYTRSLLTVGKANNGSWYLESNTGTNNAGSVAQFQPIYTDNPFSLKHWQQLDVAFTGSPTVTPTYNASVSGATLALSNAGPQAQARGSWDIDRDAPAIANTIAVQLVMSPGTWTLQGLSLQFEDLTEQRDKR